jgi:hypothetical protein
MADRDAIVEDFTAYWHPVVAVACPDCRARSGVMCKRPSGHGAADFHAARKKAADDAFISRHGADAWIERTHTGWSVHKTGRDVERMTERDAAARGEDMPLFAHGAVN